MAPLVGYLSQYRWTVETSFTGQDLHQEVCLDVLGFHAWFKKRLVDFYDNLAKSHADKLCQDPGCPKSATGLSQHYEFCSSPIKHWEQILEVVRVLGTQSQVRLNSTRHRIM